MTVQNSQSLATFESRTYALSIFLMSMGCFGLAAWQKHDAGLVIGATILGSIFLLLSVDSRNAKSQLIVYADRIEYEVLQRTMAPWKRPYVVVRRQVLPFSEVTRIRHYSKLEGHPIFFVNDAKKLAWYMTEGSSPFYSMDDWNRLLRALKKCCGSQMELSRREPWPDDEASEPWILPGWKVRPLTESDVLTEK